MPQPIPAANVRHVKPVRRLVPMKADAVGEQQPKAMAAAVRVLSVFPNASPATLTVIRRVIVTLRRLLICISLQIKTAENVFATMQIPTVEENLVHA